MAALALGGDAALAQSVDAAALATLFQQGASAYQRRDYATTIARFEELLKSAQAGPSLDSVYFTIASAKLASGDAAGAITAFQRYLQLYPSGQQVDDARSGLTQAFVKADRIPEALDALSSLQNLRGGAQGIDNHLQLAGLAVEIAEALLKDNQAARALALLQATPDRAQLIERQSRRVAELDQLYGRAKALAGPLGGDSSLAVQRDAYASRLELARQALKQIQDSPTFDLPRLLRQARCHLGLDQPWEAVVLYREILERYPDSPDRVYALHGLILARQASGRAALAEQLCGRFIKEFPSHDLAPEIAALGGQLSMDLNQAPSAETYFGFAMDKSKGELRERIVFQLGMTRFVRNDWAGAREMFDRYVSEFPKGQWVENAAYRSAVTWFLDLNDIKRYEKAEKALNAFIKARPESTYLPDARYRLTICRFAFQEYDKAVAACDEWEKLYPSDGLLPEILSLKGDILKTTGHTTEALDSYLRAASAAASDQVLGYTLNEAARLLEAGKDYARLGELFRTQVRRQPDSPLALGWYYWIARADARAGQPDQAWDFLAERAGPSLADASQEGVETLLQLMAQIRARQRRAPDAAPAPSLAERLQLTGDSAPAARARLSYYDVCLLRLTRKPDEAAALLIKIGRDFEPAALSAPLLAETGEALLKSGDTARAGLLFTRLLDSYPLSTQRDFGYVGRGDLALADARPAEALAFYEQAIDLTGAPNRLREATVGKARALFALNRLDEAAKLFESIAATKQWRGESTALSLHHLGLIAARQNDLPKAIAFFQRVFVSQGRYSEWVAKSYHESGLAFEKLGRASEAAATYREMLRNERLARFPETALARQRLAVIAP